MTFLASPNLGSGFRKAGELEGLMLFWSHPCLGERFPCQGALTEDTGEIYMTPCTTLLAKLYTSLPLKGQKRKKHGNTQYGESVETGLESKYHKSYWQDVLQSFKSMPFI